MAEVAQSRTTARAHRRSVAISDVDLVSALVDKLGTRLVAFISDKDVSAVSRWKKGSSKLRDETARTLRAAYQVFEVLEPEEGSHTIRAWFMGMNPQLDDASPAEALRDGRHREAMVAARAFLAGG